jgi:hypothetical protein
MCACACAYLHAGDALSYSLRDFSEDFHVSHTKPCDTYLVHLPHETQVYTHSEEKWASKVCEAMEDMVGWKFVKRMFSRSALHALLLTKYHTQRSSPRVFLH